MGRSLAHLSFGLLAIVCTTRGATAASVDAAAAKEAIKADVVAMSDAMAKGDFEKVAGLTHPAVLKLLGGRDKAIATMQAGAAGMGRNGFGFLGADVGEPTDPVAAGTDLYVVVPFTLTMKVPGATVRQRTFVIGQSTDKGNTWAYVNGDLNPKLLGKVLPNLPATLTLPTKQRPAIIADPTTRPATAPARPR